ncbi:MAG: hypothetical protein AAF799_13850 [Myxococcota bacterium]
MNFRRVGGFVGMVCALGLVACGDPEPAADGASTGSEGTTGSTPPGTGGPMSTSGGDTNDASTSSVADSTGPGAESSSGSDDGGTTADEDTGDETGSTGDPPAVPMPFDCVWSPPDIVTMKPDTGMNYLGGTLAMDATGAVSSVIAETTVLEYFVRRNRYDPVARTWDAGDVLTTTTVFDSNRHAVGSDAMGNSWHGWTSRNVVYGVRFDTATGWEDPLLIGGSGQSFQLLRDHALTMGPQGNIVEVWEEHDNTSWARRYNATTGTWGSVHQLMAAPIGPSELHDLSVASYGSGWALAAWRRSGLDAGLYTAMYDPASGWTESVSIGDGAQPYVAGNEAGDLVVVARTTELRAHVYDAATGSWTTGTPFFTPEDGQLGNVRVQMDVGGNVIAIWRVFSGGGNDLWAARYGAATQAWSEPELISEINAGWPLLAVNGGGHAIVAYEGGTGFATRCYDADLGVWGPTDLTEVSSLDNIWSLTANDQGDAALMVYHDILIASSFRDTISVFMAP